MSLGINTKHLKAAALCASTNGDRPALECVAVYLNERGDGYQIVATDGYTLALIQHNYTMLQGIKPDYLIKADFCKSLKPTDNIARLEPLENGFIQASITGKKGTRLEHWQIIDATYPNFLDLIKDSNDSSIASYSPKFLGTVCKLFDALKCPALTVKTEPKKVAEFCAQLDKETLLYCLLMPYNCNNVITRPCIGNAVSTQSKPANDQSEAVTPEPVETVEPEPAPVEPETVSTETPKPSKPETVKAKPKAKRASKRIHPSKKNFEERKSYIMYKNLAA